MEKINSLTGMSDLIGEKNKDSNQSDKIFQVEKKLVEIFEDNSLKVFELGEFNFDYKTFDSNFTSKKIINDLS